jgi:hypothetical protein
MTNEVLIAIVGGVVAIVTALLSNTELVKTLFNKWFINKKEKTSEVIDDLIMSQMNDLLYETSSDRVWVMNIFKGKIKMSFEKVAPGITPIKEGFQDLHAYFFSCPIQKLKEEEHYFVGDFNNLVNDSSIKEMALNNDTQATYCATIKDKNSLLSGVLGVSYSTPKEYDDDDMEKVKSYSNIISGLLMGITKE